MDDRGWDQRRLAELAAGRWVAARDAHGDSLAPPAWLAALADGAWTLNAASSTALIHPEDRGRSVSAFVTAVGEPGVAIEASIRARYDGPWNHYTVIYVNLLGVPGIDALLMFHAVTDGPPISEPTPKPAESHASTTWVVATLSENGQVTSIEGATLQLLGLDPDDVTGQSLIESAPPEQVADIISLWIELHRAPGNTAIMRMLYERPDGSTVWLDLSFLNRPGHEGDTSVLLILADATERVAQERALLESQVRAEALANDFQLLGDQVASAVVRCNPGGEVQLHNAQWTELTDGLGDATRLHDVVADHCHPDLDAALRAALTASDPGQGELEVEHASGTRTLSIEVRSEPGRGSFLAVINDVTTNVQLRLEARLDPLTGIANRTAIEVALAAALGEPAAEVVALFIDLDGFKQVNDTSGHDAGDLVLCEVARRLTAAVRDGDIVGRFGGDEFVIVCVGSETAPEQLIDRLTVALGGPITIPEGSWQPRASFGWARSRVGDDVSSLLRRADHHMYEVKRSKPSSHAPRAS